MAPTELYHRPGKSHVGRPRPGLQPVVGSEERVVGVPQKSFGETLRLLDILGYGERGDFELGRILTSGQTAVDQPLGFPQNADVSGEQRQSPYRVIALLDESLQNAQSAGPFTQSNRIDEVENRCILRCDDDPRDIVGRDGVSSFGVEEELFEFIGQLSWAAAWIIGCGVPDDGDRVTFSSSKSSWISLHQGFIHTCHRTGMQASWR